ncbi:DUF3800 domain-containing protein [Hyphomicrobium sp. D-2]|uniref:DUF3800 domain-containing protein n=1 Tax=Hyphomicrobium sp. D-2 TaxID=3041621 RepID=UPI00245520AF|nr:DUF3800 domain-containing protein [Hyphomicrobium sp. D-2]MDH4980949.1 DUF3800 domain-containing protein [Hyphomicrobium sp. D-2]
MKTIYCDESGFTGYNLLDPAQPIFAVASACVEEAEAQKILKQSFPAYQGVEFKFANLWRGGNRAGLTRFAAEIKKLEQCPFVYFIEKRFAVLTKAIDLLVEPTITEAGYDFYDAGFNWKYCNYVYFGLTEFGEPELLDAIVAHYLAFSRNPGKESLGTLQYLLTLMANSLEEPLDIFVEQMATGAELFEKFHSFDEYKKTNDLQATCMLAVVGHWRQRFNDDLAMIHDASSNFLRSKDIWDVVTRKDAPEVKFQMGDGTVVELPLRLASTKAADSKDSYAVQLCDVLAGLVTKLYHPRLSDEDETFLRSVSEAGLDSVSFNGVRPTDVFPDEIPPKKLDGPDLVDRMRAAMFARE